MIDIRTEYNEILFAGRYRTHRDVIEAALDRSISLAGANLSGLDLSYLPINDGDFRGASFKGANLTGAYAVNSNFDGANFDGANLWRINLRGAIMPDSFNVWLDADDVQVIVGPGFIQYGANRATSMECARIRSDGTVWTPDAGITNRMAVYTADRVRKMNEICGNKRLPKWLNGSN